MRLALSLLSLTLFLACDTTTTLDAGMSDRPVILDVTFARPALEGTTLAVRGLGLDRLGLDVRLDLRRAGTDIASLEVVPGSEDTLLFTVSAEVVSQLGGGAHTVDLVATGNGLASEPFEISLELAEALPVELREAPGGEVHRNDVAVLTGGGIIGASEGELSARLLGTFTPDSEGAPTEVDVSLAVSPLERTERERGVILLTTDIGGLQPGTFQGTVQLRSRLVGGSTSESTAVPTTFHFNLPDLYSLSPTEASVGQILTVRGAGFLGGPDRPTETTLLRLQGMFEPADGLPAEPFEAQEIVPRFISGTEVQLLVEPAIERDALASQLFGHTRGRFVGTAAPIAIRDTEEVEGAEVPVQFVLGPVRQVVYVRFLPGFYSSLQSFGLAQAAPELEARVQERMQGIYDAWNVDLRFEEPEDFVRTAYSVVEIGGPDPNDVGLFGYDNTPGKDIGNLRLFDSIGGTNAETQMDGYPGYGGVFVESFLFWSAHPDLPGESPHGAPNADPLFDQIFDPVRRSPATRVEARGQGSTERNEVVAAAIHALGSIIGETTSHEIGHSLGMAQPYGSPNVFHNDFDGEGCLMDSGGDRPLGERMALPGFMETHFCHEHPDYLDEILSR